MDNHHQKAAIGCLSSLCAGFLCLWPVLPTAAKGLVGKLPGNPASCPEEPCNSDPQHVLQALKWTSLAFGLILLLPLLMYYISKLISKLRSLCSSGAQSDSDIKKQVASGQAKPGKNRKLLASSKAEGEKEEEQEGKKRRRKKRNKESNGDEVAAERGEQVEKVGQAAGDSCEDEEESGREQRHQHDNQVNQEQQHFRQQPQHLNANNGTRCPTKIKSTIGGEQESPNCTNDRDGAIMAQEANSRHPSYSSCSRNQTEREPAATKLQMLDNDESISVDQRPLSRCSNNNQTPDHLQRHQCRKSSSQKSNSSSKNKASADDNLAASLVPSQHRRSIHVATPTNRNFQSPMLELNAASYLDQIHRKSFSNISELELVRSPYLQERYQQQQQQQQHQQDQLEHQQRARLHSMLNVNQLATYQQTRPSPTSTSHKSQHPGKVYPILVTNRGYTAARASGDYDGDSWIQVEAEIARCLPSGQSGLSADYPAPASGELASTKFAVKGRRADEHSPPSKLSSGHHHHHARQIELEEEGCYQTSGLSIQQNQNTLALPSVSSGHQHRHSIDGSILNRMVHRMQQGCEQVSNFTGAPDFYCYNNNEAASFKQANYQASQQRGSVFAGGVATNKGCELFSEARGIERSRPGNSSARRADRRDH